MYNSGTVAGLRVYDLRETPATTKLRPNVTLGEIACHDGTPVVIVHERLLDLLQEIRNHFASPITINSCYRTFAHNAKIGGKPDSRHCRGYAADIVVKGVSLDNLAAFLETKHVGGIGRYATFIHADVWGVSRRWKG